MITPEQLIEEFDRAVRAAEVVFRSVPEDKADWAPREGMLTCGQQMIHMAGALSFYAKGVRTGEWATRSLDEILKQNHDAPSASSALALRILRRSAEEFRALVRDLTDQAWTEPVYSPQFGTEVPRWKLILLGIEHHNTHKAELFVYLKLLGVAIGTKELYFGQQR